MIRSTLRTVRRVRPALAASMALTVWRNRFEIRRWVDFAKRAAQEPGERANALREARLRAALASDPVLRHSRANVVDRIDGNVAHLKVDPSSTEGRRSLEIASRMTGLREVRVHPPVDVVIAPGSGATAPAGAPRLALDAIYSSS